jgi:hypothetical protein
MNVKFSRKIFNENGIAQINKVRFYRLEARDQFPTGEEFLFCFMPDSGTRHIATVVYLR